MRNNDYIPLVNLQRQSKDIAREIRNVFSDVSKKGIFILGENVRSFEHEFASYLGSKYGVGVASGTDALLLSLMALGIKPGDEVIIPANSYPTAFAVAASGATIRLVDIKSTSYTLDPLKLEQVITGKTKAIIVVHLYGQAADMDEILRIAKKHKIFVIEDVAQAHGAVYLPAGKAGKGRKLGTLGILGCFSFYPTKNLGGFGDGGMVVTSSKPLAEKVKSLRVYGEKKRYESETIGINSRLDELQAALLRIKLKKLDYYNRERRSIAKYYTDSLLGVDILLPTEVNSTGHVYHLFVIRTKKRGKIKRFLLQHGVETAVHFPKPIHLVKAFAHLGYKKGDFPVAEATAKEILSLPCYPQLTSSEIKRICVLVKRFLNE